MLTPEVKRGIRAYPIKEGPQFTARNPAQLLSCQQWLIKSATTHTKARIRLGTLAVLGRGRMPFSSQSESLAAY